MGKIMNYKLKTFLYSGGVFLVSLSISLFLPLHDIFKGIASTPAIAALFFVLYQILKDHIAHEKQSQLQQQQHFFNLAITSHMSEVVFDKHVEFCQKYMSEVHKTFKTLLTDGPTEKAKDHSYNLSKLREDYAAWITNDIHDSLKEFEDTVHKIGRKERLSNTSLKPDIAIRAGEEADQLWEAVLGTLLDSRETPNQNKSVENIENKLRDILGIDVLIKLRKKLLAKAVRSLEINMQ